MHVAHDFSPPTAMPRSCPTVSVKIVDVAEIARSEAPFLNEVVPVIFCMFISSPFRFDGNQREFELYLNASIHFVVPVDKASVRFILEIDSTHHHLRTRCLIP